MLTHLARALSPTTNVEEPEILGLTAAGRGRHNRAPGFSDRLVTPLFFLYPIYLWLIFRNINRQKSTIEAVPPVITRS
jgi:hypothetical protein